MKRGPKSKWGHKLLHGLISVPSTFQTKPTPMNRRAEEEAEEAEEAEKEEEEEEEEEEIWTL